MRTSTPLSEMGERASARYRTLILAFRGSYDAAVNLPDALSQAGINWLSGQLYAIAAVHLTSEHDILADESEWVAWEAHRDASKHLGYDVSSKLPDALSSALSASQTYIQREIATQLERDITQTLKHYRNLAMKVDMHHQATGGSRDKSLVSVKIGDEQPRHWFQDRAARRWPSQKFIRTLWRGTMHGLYNESYLYTLASFGETQAVIWHPDSSHKWYGEDIFLGDKVPTYYEIRDDVFHPNSNAMPRAVRFFEEAQ